jgi:hypothetical protein
MSVQPNRLPLAGLRDRVGQRLHGSRSNAGGSCRRSRRTEINSFVNTTTAWADPTCSPKTPPADW